MPGSNHNRLCWVRKNGMRQYSPLYDGMWAAGHNVYGQSLDACDDYMDKISIHSVSGLAGFVYQVLLADGQ